MNYTELCHSVKEIIQHYITVGTTNSSTCKSSGYQNFTKHHTKHARFIAGYSSCTATKLSKLIAEMC